MTHVLITVDLNAAFTAQQVQLQGTASITVMHHKESSLLAVVCPITQHATVRESKRVNSSRLCLFIYQTFFKETSRKRCRL